MEIKEIVPKQGCVIYLDILLTWLAQMRTGTMRMHRNAPHMRRAELCLLRAAWELLLGEGGERA